MLALVSMPLEEQLAGTFLHKILEPFQRQNFLQPLLRPVLAGQTQIANPYLFFVGQHSVKVPLAGELAAAGTDAAGAD